MTSETDVPVSGSDDARSAESGQADKDRRDATAKAEQALHSGTLSGDGEMDARRLAREYLQLGGRRRSKIDDNITDVRQWEPDPPEAEQFWKEQIESLPDDERKQVEDFLPSITNP